MWKPLFLSIGIVILLWGPSPQGAEPLNHPVLPNVTITLRVALFTFRNPYQFTLSPSAIARVRDPEGREIATCSPDTPLQVRWGGKGVDVLGASYPYIEVVPETGSLLLSNGSLKRAYRGWIQIHPASEGLLAVNLVALEAYVAGVVGAEMPSRAPLEALKAQAVAVRSFAVSRALKGSTCLYDLEDTHLAQVYPGLQGENPSALQATTLTANEILLYKGKPALALYHAASGGVTASLKEVFDGEEVPYLSSVEDCDETGKPYEGATTSWVWEVKRADLASLLSRAGWKEGEVVQVRILERGESGRVTALRVVGKGVELVLRKGAIREALGAYLPSTFFEVESIPDGWRFIGRGRGHGVGMSQLGSIGRARRGQNYLQILQAYYPNTEVVKVLHSPLLLARGERVACRFIPVFP
ncbi:MAG: SpoIID/LytB domain-containing protein [Fimbriimonadales bacterium]|nr:SpoIID/LytB domain-containing protein [Fimbriimonadales bacterium]